MNIPFRRVTTSPQTIEVSGDGVKLEGTLSFKQRNIVMLDGEINGKLSVPCDICAEQFDIILHDKVKLLLSDGIYQGSDDEYDVIEMNDIIDLDELLHSEIELIRSDYHTCKRCEDNEGVENAEKFIKE